MQGSNFDQLISDHPGVTDFFLHNKVDDKGASKSILFIVVDEFYSTVEIQTLISNDNTLNHTVDFIVPVTTIPLDRFGKVDFTALDSLYVFDQSCLSNNVQHQIAQQHHQDVVTMLTPNSFDTQPLYLNDLIQAGTSHLQKNEENQQQINQIKSTSTTLLAYSDGGVLDIPEGAPNVLIDCILRAASMDNGNKVVSFRQAEERSLDYSQLLAQASKVLCGLRKQGHKVGSPFIFQFADNAEFLISFWGCLLGGYVPVPMALAADYQNDQSAIENIQRVSEMLGHAAILTSSDMHADVSAMPWLHQQASVTVIDCTELQNNPIDSEYYQASEDEVTLIMLTSGTTGAPKGVPLTHKNLISRSIGSNQVNGFSEQTRSLNWMPLDHVAGIIFFHLRDVYLGCTQVHVAATDILASPLTWIDLLERFQATVTFAPNFAFGLIAGLSDEIAQRSWDLSALKLVLNGGEAVVASTARQFLQLFENSGLCRHAMCPAWGMSETSSGITYARDFELDNTSDSDSHVSVGPPMPGDFMRITDAQNKILNEGDIGRLQVKGRTVFHGYFQNPEANEEAFTEDGWFNTGDLGILVDGKLTITGREKDVIIVNGVNYSGPGIESIVEDIEQITRSFVAACAVADPHQGGKECLAIFFVYEGKLTAPLLRTIKGQVTSKAGVSPEYLVPLQNQLIPKTSIGKIQRTKLKNSFEAGDFYQQIKTADMLLGNHCIPAWLFQSHWHVNLPTKIYSLAQKRVVIFANLNTTSSQLVSQLNSLGAKAILVSASDTLNLNSITELQVRSNVSADYAAVMSYLSALDISSPIEHVVCLWSLHDNERVQNWTNPEHGAELNFALVACAAGVAQHQSQKTSVQLTYLTQDAQPWGNRQVSAAHAGLPALIKTLKQELAETNYVHIDLAANDADTVNVIIDELQTKQAGKDVIWRNQKRYTSELNFCQLATIHSDSLAPERPAGFVLSGGLGGIGQQLTKTLLQSANARVLVLGRSSLQQVEQQHMNFSKWLKSTVNLSYLPIDVTDSEAVEHAVQDWLAEQQVSLFSIFHLAGGYHESALVDESINGFSDLAATKLAGAKSLANLLNHYPQANLVNFSSTAGVFGGATIGAYAAASCALDGLSHNLRLQGLRCFDINWSSWRATGMSEGNTAIEALRARGILELDIDAAINSLRLVLGQADAGQYIIGLDPQNPDIRRLVPNSLNSLIPVVFSSSKETMGTEKLDFADNFAQSFQTPVLQIDSIPRLADGQPDTTALSLIASQGNTEVVLAKTETEKIVVEIWKKILNLDTVSIHWNFFDVGGQSITATKLIAAIRTQFAVNWTLKDIFSAATCEQQATAIDLVVSQSETQILEQVDIPILDRSIALPLSSAQKRLWFIEQLDIPSSAYNVTAGIRFDHAPEQARLEHCLNTIISHQESLRVVFPSQGGVPKQHVMEVVNANINLATVETLSEYNQLLVSEGRYHFDLTTGPLLRATLVNFKDKFTLVLTLHHIISDGWSMRVLFQQFESLYSSPNSFKLSANKVQYADYAAWQQSKLEKGDYQQQLTYWQRNLEGALSGFGIPTDFPRPQVQTYNGKRLQQRIPAKLTGQLQEFAKQRNKTAFVLLLTAFKVLLARYAQQSDVLVGTVVANRDFAQVENLIGFFVNPVVLRTDVTGTFEKLLDVVNHTTLDAVANHNIPFEYLADKLQPPRDTSRSPLFQIAFDFRDPDLTRSESQQLAFTVMEADLGTAKYDLHLTLEEAGSEIVAYWEYNTDLFAEQTIERMTLNYQRLLESVIKSPEQKISAIDLLSPTEITLQNSWNQTDAPYQSTLCMHQLFELAVQNRGDDEAVRFGQQTLSYKQINQKANQLARELIAQGAQQNSLVAMCVERCVDTVICVLAILKSGAAYMALDPSYPQQRLSFMLEDSNASILLTRSEYSNKFTTPTTKTVIFDSAESVAHHDASNLGIASKPSDLAYVIYTSGSTGTPKGVMLEHGGWCNIAQAQIDSFGLQSGMRVLQFASMSFDASAFELAMAWGSQGTLVMGAKEDVLPGPALANLLKLHQIQVVTLPPTALSALGDERLPDLQVVTVAGEACSAELVRKWAQGRRFFNLYGPTETTIWASYAECFQTDEGLPVIGKPVANTQLFVLDEHLNRLPAGMPGELGIAGVGVARGYINRDELNIERFIENQFSNNAKSKIYRSGDLVKYRTDGNLEFLGRIDHQVKVRGFRIELGEIEAVLRKYPNVTEAVVVALQNQVNEKTLFAYVSMPNPEGADALAIRAFLKESLTDYMVPSQIFVLASLPLSLNGKVDRKALPSPESLREQTQTAVSNASSSMENVVSDIWKNVLGLSAIDINQNFFDIGGHSLKMAQVQTQLAEKLGSEVSLVDLFQYTTIKSLANHLDSLNNEKVELAPKAEKQKSKVSGQQRLAKMAAMKKRQGR